MQRHAERRADVRRGELAVKVIAHGTVGRLAEAAAGEEAAQAADDVAERDARREHVGDRPQRQPVPPQVPQRDDDGGDQAAVEDAARADQRQQLAPGSAGDCPQSTISSSSLAPTSALMMIQMPRSMTRFGSRPRALARTSANCRPEQVGGGQQHAVGVDREAADLKQDGIHGCRPRPIMSRRTRIAPTVIAASATLNAQKCALPQ